MLVHLQISGLLDIDTGYLSASALLDLTSAFITVDHDIITHLIHHLKLYTFRLSGENLHSFETHLTSRRRCVLTRHSTSVLSTIFYNVSQGSVGRS